MKLNSKITRLGLTGILAMGAIATLPSVHAFGLDSVKQIAGGVAGSKEEKAIDVDALLSQQENLLGRFNSSMNNMLLAQARTLEAGGLKEEAQRAAAAAENYSSGNVVTKDQLERDTQSTAENLQKIEELKAKDVALTAEGRKLLAAAVPHYAKGLYEGTQLPDAFESWSSNAKGGLNSLAANPLKAKKLTSGLDDVVTVTQELPALLKAWGSTSSAFVSYAKSNRVDVGDVEGALGDL